MSGDTVAVANLAKMTPDADTNYDNRLAYGVYQITQADRL